jgi:hypothetical protein
MNRHFFTIAFLLGVTSVVWVGARFIDSSLLALAMTTAIGAVFVFGAAELRQFRRATATLQAALAAIAPGMSDLDAWLGRVHPSLRNAVRLRIEGERVALPGPGLTPYLVGLLVMLGMLGTFLGMVVTLNGAVFALNKTSDLEAIRSALAVPVMGLGLAFGTSVAGVATSAMLGLMSALSRRERALTAQSLDGAIAVSLRPFSLIHQRQETFRALQLQSQCLPQVAEKMQAMMAQMEDMSQRLNQRLLSNQEAFHGDTKAMYADLAGTVGKALSDSLRLGAQAAGDSIRPVFEAAMQGVAQDAIAMHARMADTVQAQLDGVSARFDAAAAAVSANWASALRQHEQASGAVVADLGRSLQSFNAAFDARAAALAESVGDAYLRLQAGQAEQDAQRQQAWTQSLQDVASALAAEWRDASAHTLARQNEICDDLRQAMQAVGVEAQSAASASIAETSRLIAGAEALMRERMASEAQWMAQHRTRMDEMAAGLRAELAALRDDEAARGDAAVERLGQLQAALASHLTTLGAALEAPLARLIDTASEAPRAAADVIGQLRQQVSESTARDNALLEERGRIMHTLDGLLTAIAQSTQEQRAVIDSLVDSSARALDATARTFADNIAAETASLTDAAAQIGGSAVDVSSLSDAFGFTVTAFAEANEHLIASLQRIEGALDKSMARSDEQLAYYVAQAREIIDLSMMSQKDIVDALRRLPGRQPALADEAG